MVFCAFCEIDPFCRLVKPMHIELLQSSLTVLWMIARSVMMSLIPFLILFFCISLTGELSIPDIFKESGLHSAEFVIFLLSVPLIPTHVFIISLFSSVLFSPSFVSSFLNGKIGLAISDNSLLVVQMS